MLNIKDVNRYFVRLTKLPSRPELAGQVIYLRHVATNGIVVSQTDDCRPSPTMIPLPPAANDDGWYDVTELILDANCAITPRQDMCAFLNETASQYRNHVDDPSVLHPCSGRDAAGQLCFLGVEQGGRLELSRTAYFVVSMDEHSFYIVYGGFCEPKKSTEVRKPVQRVLRLEGSGRRFYEAEPIVTACNAAYRGDVARRDKYVADLNDKVAASSTATTHAADPKRDASRLAGMQLD